MRHDLRIAFGLAASMLMVAGTAQAQYAYPRGYGGYGWGGWGADPAAGYMAGLGSYARGQGAYEVLNAQARSINLDTMLKWNKALRARQKALREEQQKQAVRDEAARDERVTRAEILDGTTLNKLMAQIFDFDPSVVRSGRARLKLSASAIREIPFEWDTEAISICINQMTARDALPPALSGPNFVDERNALREALDEAIREDAKGDVSAKTAKRLTEAISAFRARFRKSDPDFDLEGNAEAETYFTTLSSLSRMLHDPSMKKILAELDDGRDRTVGDLISFMQSYNLRFGPSTSERQGQIYERLVPLLASVATDVGVPEPPAPAVDKTGKPLQAAAKDAFKKMEWNQLDAHARGIK